MGQNIIRFDRDFRKHRRANDFQILLEVLYSIDELFSAAERALFESRLLEA
jgi:hypothetical protein